MYLQNSRFSVKDNFTQDIQGKERETNVKPRIEGGDICLV